MEFKKSILLPLVLSIIGVLVAVVTFITIQFANKVDEYIFGPDFLAIVFLIIFVLFLSALSAKKATFSKVVCVISISVMLVGLFITSIVCSVVFNMMENVTWDTFAFLAMSILSLVAGILFLIYYLIGKKDTLFKLSYILNIVVLIFLVAFAGMVFASAFVGVLKSTKAYGCELALLLLNAALVYGLVFSLQKRLGRAEKEQPKEEPKEEPVEEASEVKE